MQDTKKAISKGKPAGKSQTQLRGQWPPQQWLRQRRSCETTIKQSCSNPKEQFKPKQASFHTWKGCSARGGRLTSSTLECTTIQSHQSHGWREAEDTLPVGVVHQLGNMRVATLAHWRIGRVQRIQDAHYCESATEPCNLPQIHFLSAKRQVEIWIPAGLPV